MRQSQPLDALGDPSYAIQDLLQTSGFQLDVPAIQHAEQGMAPTRSNSSVKTKQILERYLKVHAIIP